MGSNQKIKNNESRTNNNKRKNKAHHYKSRSLMDIENPISLKNHPKNIRKDNNNYIITDNQKITKIRSTKCASVKAINKNNNIYNNNKSKKPFINISFVNLHTNDNKQTFEMKKYKGPIDLNCLLVTKSIHLLIDKISTLLKRYKITNIFINQYKLRCSKNGESFDIEFMSLNDNLIKINNSFFESSYENDSKYKTITESTVDKNANIYYYMIISKMSKKKNLLKSVNKIINSKYGINKNKK